MRIDEAELKRRFNERAIGTSAVGRDAANAESIVAVLREAAHQIIQRTTPGREQSMAVTKLEEAMHWSLSAIGCIDAKIESDRKRDHDDEQQGRSVAELERRGMIEEPVTDEIADASSDFATPV